MDGWPQVVTEDIVKQAHKLKNEMFVMGGKIKGRTLLPIPEHLGSLDGTLESMERWAAPPPAHPIPATCGVEQSPQRMAQGWKRRLPSRRLPGRSWAPGSPHAHPGLEVQCSGKGLHRGCGIPELSCGACSCPAV